MPRSPRSPASLALIGTSVIGLALFVPPTRHVLGKVAARALGTAGFHQAAGDEPVIPTFVIRGGARLQWTQPGSSEVSPARTRLYVDGTPVPTESPSCTVRQQGDGFECQVPMPPLPTGRHVLRLSVVLADGTESALSSLLAVDVESGAPAAHARTDGPGVPGADGVPLSHGGADGQNPGRAGAASPEPR